MRSSLKIEPLRENKFSPAVVAIKKRMRNELIAIKKKGWENSAKENDKKTLQKKKKENKISICSIDNLIFDNLNSILVQNENKITL